MSSKLFWIFILSLTVGAFAQRENGTEKVDARNGKVFSLFSVVQFKNTGCKSQSSMTSGQSTVRNGTCFTSSECTSKGGSASGNCASGFGVCCLFLVTATGSIINQNCTYLRNPSFPSVYSATSSLSYTVNKCSNDICFLRLDFETFNTVPVTAVETTSCPDQFKITTSTSQPIPTICGANTGQHIYVDIGNQATDSAAISFTFSTTTSTIRTWEIKISQIGCSNPNRPPLGCLQYWTTLVGRFTTFNWLTTSGSSNLPSNSYSACIRRAAGYCCVQYQVCAGQTMPFSLDAGTAASSLTDSKCTGDYVAIPGSHANVCSKKNQSLANKYCGYYLGGYVAAANLNTPICDCTAPFEIYVYTDNALDLTTAYSRGNCLDFNQVPCDQV